MIQNNNQYLYDIENGIGCQLQENQKLKFHNNEQTELRKTYKTNNKIKDICINQKQTARKKPGIDSRLDTCYCVIMTQTQQQYLYSIANDTGSQEPTTRNLEFHSNEHNKLNNDNESIQKFSFEDLCGNKSKTARKKLGVDSQLDTCYSYTVKNNHNQYLYDIENDTGSQEPKNRNLEFHSNEQKFELKIKESCINHQFAYELDLRGKQSDVLSAIYIVSSSSGVCFATNEWIANHFRLCKKTISNYIKRFEELGLLVSEHYKRIGKHIRNLYLTEKFFEMAEKCECTRIKRNIETWEEKRAKRENAKIENTKEVPAKPIKSTYENFLPQRINNISKYIYKKGSSSKTAIKKRIHLKPYNDIIKEYVNLKFDGNDELKDLLKRFVVLKFKYGRKSDRNYYLLNGTLEDHLQRLSKLSHDNLISALAIARLTVVNGWKNFFPLTKKKQLHIDKHLQKKSQPLFNHIRKLYETTYGINDPENAIKENDRIVCKYSKFEDELYKIKNMMIDLKRERARKSAMGISAPCIGSPCVNPPPLGSLDPSKTNLQVDVMPRKSTHEEYLTEKYGCLNAINSGPYEIVIDNIVSTK